MLTFTSTSEFYPSKTVTIVIPAYNEDPCMGAGLSAVCGVDLVNQIIYGWPTFSKNNWLGWTSTK